MGRKIFKTRFDGIEAGFGSQHGKPGGPDVGWNQKISRIGLQEQFQQVPGIESQNGPAIGYNIAYLPQFFTESFRRFQVRCENKIMIFPGPPFFFINIADLGAQYKTDRPPTWFRHMAITTVGQIFPEPEKAGLGRYQFFADFGKPSGMGEISGAD
ncbi:MAG: hypothetical protein JEZ11_19680 [Desulfobacterales bacterium]|nr:hypothetical protein [Desulfobacterales bacterium]